MWSTFVPSAPPELSRSARSLLLLVLLLGVVLRVSLFELVPRATLGDIYHHVLLASNLLQGRGYSHSPTPPYYPDLQRPPALPLVLAGAISLSQFSGVPAPVLMLLLQTALDLGTGLILYRRLRQMASQLALPALALYLLSPYAAFFPSLALTECLAGFLLMAILDRALTLAKSPTAGGAAVLGALAALLILTRPALLPVAALALLACRRQLPLALLTCSLLLLPWTIRNATLPGGRPTPLLVSGLGITLWFGVTFDGAVHLTGRPPAGEAEFQRYLLQWRQGKDLPPEEVVAIDRHLSALAVQAIRDHPAAYLVHVLAQAGRLWWAADDGLVNYDASRVPRARLHILFLVSQTCQRILVVLAVGGLIVGGRRLGPVWVLLAVVSLPYCLIHVEARYLLPLEPVLAGLAAAFLWWLKETLTRARTRTQSAR